MFSKILIANRGEIACRVIRTAKRLGIQTVAVYSEVDAGALHVRMADEAVLIGPAPSSQSYLKSDVILKAAQQTGAQAIHPGYGFLSENADFSKACKKAGIVFIGPSEKSINAMGLKDEAKAIMEKAGVPTVPGYKGANQEAKFLKEQADKIGYPVLIKAVAGGGGKGMRLVEKSADFLDLLGNCQREGKASFGNDHVLIEKYITKPRHIEMQVFGDTHGNVVHLFERDCSLQRRHQKVVEEAPAPGMTDKMRKAMGDAAVKAAEAIDYYGAGTIEFIVDTATNDFYFMEMNTRLQVEHPVTEMITGLDLVEWQLRVAAGEKLPLAQKDLSINGHAFEVRFYAEDPAQNFLPQTGPVRHFSYVLDDGMRVDTGIEAGDKVTSFYDPMIAKLIVWDKDRADAAAKMLHLLSATKLTGLNTNQEFLAAIFREKDFLKGDVDTGFIPRHEKTLMPADYGQPRVEELALACLYYALDLGAEETDDPWTAGGSWRSGVTPASRIVELSVRDQNFAVKLSVQGRTIRSADFEASLAACADGHIEALVNGHRIAAGIVADGKALSIFHQGRVVHMHPKMHDADDDHGASNGRIVTPMPGRVVSILVKKGESVEKGQPLLIMESMKVEITIRAGCAGRVEDLSVAVNDQLPDGALLAQIAAKE
ncbi:MAG TPA: acetyl/propionyl/methylcrotonyl-CoA carboxylase subunit alpha [Alphaproteobacteria bacterium]|nr:acetyl/propionyl/methylcrotonyl-CoA carboxylase subunit alpha [Alphaproteobacteria bacterium]